MKKRMLLIILGALLALSACNTTPMEEKPNNGKDKPFTVNIAENYPTVNQLNKTYAPEEEVTLKLETVTEHYYVVYVNGQEIEADSSDMEYTYFKFIMPYENVTVKIEDRWVDIPEAPEQVSYGYKSFQIGDTLYYVDEETGTSILKNTGDEVVTLVEGENLIADILFHNGKIYYCDAFGVKLYVMDTNGENKQLLLDVNSTEGFYSGEFSDWRIYKDNLYLSCNVTDLYKIDLKTHQWEMFNNDVSKFHFYNDALYYIDHAKESFTIYNQDLKTKEIETFLGIGDTHDKNEVYSNFVIGDDGTFYVATRAPYTSLLAYKDGHVELIESYENLTTYYDSFDELSLSYHNGKLYYVKNSNGVSTLCRYDGETKGVEEISIFSGYKKLEYVDDNVFCYYREFSSNPEDIICIKFNENKALFKSGKIPNNTDFHMIDDNLNYWLDASHVEKVNVMFDEEYGYYLEFELTEDGKSKLFDATSANLDRFISFGVGTTLMATHKVSEPIENGVLTFINTQYDALYLFNLLTGAPDKTEGLIPPHNRISAEQAQNIVYEKAGVTADNVIEIETNLEFNESWGLWQYSIYFETNDNSYLCEVSAILGSIMKFNSLKG